MKISPRSGLEATYSFLETLAHANTFNDQINEVLFGTFADALVTTADNFNCKAKLLALSAAVTDTCRKLEDEGITFDDDIQLPHGKMSVPQLYQLFVHLTSQLDSYILYERHFTGAIEEEIKLPDQAED